MVRWLILFVVSLVVVSFGRPWLLEVGIVPLPGDLSADLVPGLPLDLPLTTSLLVSATIGGVWALLDR